MPDKPLTVLTYAASASLAAVALVYFFNPSYIHDGAGLSRRGRASNNVVGLYNPANDCFINSVLQALAGLGELRVYLIRELHRRELDQDGRIYRLENEEHDGAEPGSGAPTEVGVGGGSSGRKRISGEKERQARSLLSAEVTRGLKAMLDALNERPLKRKVISAHPFVAVLESAFATRVNRNQQDAQELLQIVAERLADEYAAGKQARDRVKQGRRSSRLEKHDQEQDLGVSWEMVNEEDRREQALGKAAGSEISKGHELADTQGEENHTTTNMPTVMISSEETIKAAMDKEQSPTEGGFPMEGQTKSQIECQHCKFVPSSTPSSFIMLTLSVPAQRSATLNQCFDQAFKTEYIDDYRCDRCRLEFAVTLFEKELQKSRSRKLDGRLESDIERLRKAIDEDPEKPPEDIQLPDIKLAPTRRIARSVAITTFPKILVIHLSRSAFDPGSYSSKNEAKVVFPERLPLGSLLHRRHYRLLAVVTHKGTHHSGHYETFRRQHAYQPTSNPLTDPDRGSSEGQSRSRPSATPELNHKAKPDDDSEPEDIARESVALDATAKRGPSALSHRSKTHLVPDAPSPATSPRLSTSSLTRESVSTLPTPASVEKQQDSSSSSSPSSLDVRDSTAESPGVDGAALRPRVRDRLEEAKEKKREEMRRRAALREGQRWWRISDEKVRECKTSDVLGMQKEVYLLFYEMENV